MFSKNALNYAGACANYFNRKALCGADQRVILLPQLKKMRQAAPRCTVPPCLPLPLLPC